MDLNKSVAQIEVVDTVVAFLAGVMIIPAIYVFSGMDGMSAGPSLMFVALPKTFYAMGTAGRVIGLVFFLLAAFAALTSCISVLESKLYGDLSYRAKENDTGVRCDLSGGNRCDRFGLQSLLSGDSASKRNHRTAFRYYGLYQ